MKMSSKRSANFTQEEVKKLVNLVKKYKDIIQCKKSNVVCLTKKMQAWREITEEFNYGRTSNHRELQTLKIKYENIKKTARKKLADEKRQLYGTGGVKAEPVSITDVDELVGEISQDQVTGLQSFFDWESINLDSQQTSSSKISEKTNVLPDKVSNNEIAENSKTADIANTSGTDSDEDLNVVKKQKATTSILHLPRKRKLKYKIDLCLDKWQQFADETTKSVKDEKQWAKEKHELEMKLFQEEHDLKIQIMKDESELKKEKLKLEILALKKTNNMDK